MIYFHVVVKTLIIVVALASGVGGEDESEYVATGYGVDVSFPMHWLPKAKSPEDAKYQSFLKDCTPMRSCVSNEQSRMAMNRDQPCRQRNYTEVGFGRIKAPAAAYAPARAFWDAHRDQKTVEQWPPGNTYVNNWVAPTHMVSLEDRRFQPTGARTKDAIWNGMKPVLEAWTGQKLKPTSLYGVRVYGEGAILATHVDRLPLVTSAVMQIDQDVDEPWPIEVVGHDGRAYNVTLEPGEVALYESHTVLHGRPRPLRGKFFANVFIHFIPVDDDDANEKGVNFNWQREARSRKIPALDFPEPVPSRLGLPAARRAAEANDELARVSGVSRSADEKKKARTISEASQSRAERRANARAAISEATSHQIANGEDFGSDAFSTGTTTALHAAAAGGDLPAVNAELENNPNSVNAADENLWTPLHESVRAGSLAVVTALVLAGADLGARTVGGGTALWIAKQHHQTRVVAYLESIGAPEIADEL
ncbi:hypothetical protein CTAYLR_004436 [Chrysophaeum taylorii]|uniref:Uncharacterized protein n=1 Tax=Chrysophaeum taylorii TaxID=2483200 RepID=A0AAD7XN45_9STRA|nr:hypothetical protein CTAYLR_004436 [Chrysophaeum taylorii]